MTFKLESKRLIFILFKSYYFKKETKHVKHHDIANVDTRLKVVYVQKLKKKKKKKRNTLIYFNTNYNTETKLVSIIIDHCLLGFDALNLFLGSVRMGGLYLSLIFSM